MTQSNFYQSQKIKEKKERKKEKREREKKKTRRKLFIYEILDPQNSIKKWKTNQKETNQK